MSKLRLDQLLVDRGLFAARGAAKAAVMAGTVKVGGAVTRQAGKQVDPLVQIEVAPRMEYASRAGGKLHAVLEELGISVAGKVALDSGSSTGGFTDCLLSEGARKVIAVDVGYGLLAWRLRQDERVEVHDRTNLRYIKPTDISEPVEIATLDLSFISLEKVLASVKACLVPDGEVLALIKPQFEVGKGKVGRGGIVKDVSLHREVITKIAGYARIVGLFAKGVAASAVPGAKGNVEYWLYAGARADALGEVELAAAIEAALKRGRELA